MARIWLINQYSSTPATLSARQDGYTRLPNGPLHCRRWTLTETGLRIQDQLDPATLGEERFHLPPGVSVEINTTDPAANEEPSGLLHLPSGRRLRWRARKAAARIDATTWHPCFGESQPCTCLALTFNGDTTFELDWT